MLQQLHVLSPFAAQRLPERVVPEHAALLMVCANAPM